MERPNAWKDYTAEQLDELHYLCEGYKAFISDNKTERECAASAVALAEEHGYLPLDQAVPLPEPGVPVEPLPESGVPVEPLPEPGVPVEPLPEPGVRAEWPLPGCPK